MSRQMYRHEVPVSSEAEFELTGNPVAVAPLPLRDDGVEFWAEHDDAALPFTRTFMIAGTGHPIPDGAAYVGTAARSQRGLVWHLFELGAKT